MKKLVLIAGLASLGLAASALAGGPDVAPASNSGFYAGINGGVADAGGNNSGYSDLFNTGFDLGGQVGYRFNKNFREEVAVDYLRQSVDSANANGNNGHLSTVMAMVNGYYDIDFGSPVVPFVGAGIGFYHQDVDNTTQNVSVSDDEFAYQGIAGVAYNFSKNMSVDAAYHYVAWTNNDGAHQNLFNLGLNYYFS